MIMKNTTMIAIESLEKELHVDLGSNTSRRDITTEKLMKNDPTIKVNIVAREKLTLCGIRFIKAFVKKLDKRVKFLVLFEDGQEVKKNKTIAVLSGSSKLILKIERTILNFLQHLSSISTSTSKLVKKIGDSQTKLLDTRKTITGLRILQKYATKIGGAENHRKGLYDQILIKDNHIRILGGIEKTLDIISKKKIKNYKIECDTLDQVTKAIKSGAKYILLDNMNKKVIKKCLKLQHNKKVIFEITGGVNNKNIKEFSSLNADYISVGSITQSPIPIDIAIDIY